MSKEEITVRLQNILRKRFGMDLKGKWQEVKNYPLLGYKLGIGPGQLLYLFFDIEEEFNIRIPENSIVNGDFHSLDSIAGIIADEYKGNDDERL